MPSILLIQLPGVAVWHKGANKHHVWLYVHLCRAPTWPLKMLWSSQERLPSE
jgi:hypothetical protein